jgi:hypothetical protein
MGLFNDKENEIPDSSKYVDEQHRVIDNGERGPSKWPLNGSTYYDIKKNEATTGYARQSATGNGYVGAQETYKLPTQGLQWK